MEAVRALREALEGMVGVDFPKTRQARKDAATSALAATENVVDREAEWCPAQRKFDALLDAVLSADSLPVLKARAMEIELKQAVGARTERKP